MEVTRLGQTGLTVPVLAVLGLVFVTECVLTLLRLTAAKTASEIHSRLRSVWDNLVQVRE